MIGSPRAAVVTIAHGRHQHLRHQLRSLQPADASMVQIVVAMGDPEIERIVDAHRRDNPRDIRCVTIEIPDDAELPLGPARNLGAAEAMADGADLLIFLDVDCLATPTLISNYRQAVGAGDAPAGPVLWCGEVAYLPPLPDGLADYPLGELDGWAEPHPARPRPEPGSHQFSSDMRLFWSLNFAVTARDWGAGAGFHPEFRGYGGEDTDLAMMFGSLGGAIGWIGGARAYHQHHPTSSPPWQHVAAIVRNSWVFRERWGWFPMQGWLTDFDRAGVIEFRPEDDVLRVLSRPGR